MTTERTGREGKKRDGGREGDDREDGERGKEITWRKGGGRQRGRGERGNNYKEEGRVTTERTEYEGKG